MGEGDNVVVVTEVADGGGLKKIIEQNLNEEWARVWTKLEMPGHCPGREEAMERIGLIAAERRADAKMHAEDLEKLLDIQVESDRRKEELGTLLAKLDNLKHRVAKYEANVGRLAKFADSVIDQIDKHGPPIHNGRERVFSVSVPADGVDEIKRLVKELGE